MVCFTILNIQMYETANRDSLAKLERCNRIPNEVLTSEEKNMFPVDDALLKKGLFLRDGLCMKTRESETCTKYIASSSRPRGVRQCHKVTS